MSQWRKYHKDVLSQKSSNKKASAAQRKKAKEVKKDRAGLERAIARSGQTEETLETAKHGAVLSQKAMTKQGKKGFGRKISVR